MAAATSSLHLSALLPFPPGLVRRRQRRPPRFSALRFSHPPSQPLRISATQFSVSSLALCSYEISPFAYLLLLLILPTLPGSWKSLQEFCRRLVGVSIAVDGYRCFSEFGFIAWKCEVSGVLRIGFWVWTWGWVIPHDCDNSCGSGWWRPNSKVDFGRGRSIENHSYFVSGWGLHQHSQPLWNWCRLLLCEDQQARRRSSISSLSSSAAAADFLAPLCSYYRFSWHVSVATTPIAPDFANNPRPPPLKKMFI